MAEFKFFGRVENPYVFAFGGGAWVEVEAVTPELVTLINPVNYAKIQLKGKGLLVSADFKVQQGTVTEVLITDQDDQPIYQISGSRSIKDVIGPILRYQRDGDSRAFDKILGLDGGIHFNASESDRALTEMDSWIPKGYINELTDHRDVVRLEDRSDAVNLGVGDTAYAGSGAKSISANGSLVYLESGNIALSGSGVADFSLAIQGAYTFKAVGENLTFDWNGDVYELQTDDKVFAIKNADAALKTGWISIDMDRVEGSASFSVNAGDTLILTSMDHAITQSQAELLGSYREDHSRGIVADLLLEGAGKVILNPSYYSFIDSWYNPPYNDGIYLDLDVRAGTLRTSRLNHPDDLAKIEVGADLTLEVVGTDYADRFIGGDEDDIFYPHLGNDTIDGGGGYDTLHYKDYDPSRALYQTHHLANAPESLVVDMRQGLAQLKFQDKFYEQKFQNIDAIFGTLNDDIFIGDGTSHSLHGEEGNDVFYGDGFKVWHSLPEANQIYRIYQAVFGRAPDVAGHEGWTKALSLYDADLASIVRDFMSSAEFRAKYVGLNNEAFIELLYKNVLGRGSDPAGLEHWLGHLEAGAGRHNVVLGFANSGEFLRATEEKATDFSTSQDQSEQLDDIYRLYKATLAREPDLAGVKGWLGHMGAGMTLEQVARSFVASPEFALSYGDLANRDFVELLYQNVLGRPADEAGLSAWVARLEGGYSREKILLGFSQSPEFMAQSLAPMEAWVRQQGVTTLVGGAGDDVLHSGLLSETFVFRHSDKGKDLVLGADGWDLFAFEGFGYESRTELRARMSAQGEDILFSDQGVEVLIKDFRIADLSDDMLLI